MRKTDVLVFYAQATIFFYWIPFHIYHSWSLMCSKQNWFIFNYICPTQIQHTHTYTPDLGALSCDNLNTVGWKTVYCKLSMRIVLLDEPSYESSIFPWLHIVYHTHNICIDNHLKQIKSNNVYWIHILFNRLKNNFLKMKTLKNKNKFILWKQ